MTRPSFIAWAALVAMSLVRPARAQCVEWSSGEFVTPGVDGEVRAFLVYDDGSGEALYAGGAVLRAGAVVARSVARFDGAAWSPLGNGLDAGLSWRYGVEALAAFDDGGGTALYAGGRFRIDGDTSERGIARWDGLRWSAVGDESGPKTVDELVVFDDGSGPALFAAGWAEPPGSRGGIAIMKWDGAAWTTIAFGGNGYVHSLAVFDDGTGRALWASARDSRSAGPRSSRVARWDGASWTNAKAGLGGPVNVLAVHDDGSGSALYAGGSFAGGGLARWDGSAWRTISPGVTGEIRALASVVARGSGRSLAVAGSFSDAGGRPAAGAALFDGASWTPLGDGFGQPVTALAEFDSGSGPALFAAIDLNFPPPSFGPRRGAVSRWDGARWLPSGPGFDSVPHAIAVFDDGRGPALFVAGGFSQAEVAAASGLARFDGSAWSEMGGGIEGGRRIARVLAAFDDGSGPALYAGGDFASAGGLPARNVVRWDGTALTPLGSGLGSVCLALAVFDEGTGPALYAGGDFIEAGGVTARRVARWDGSAWSPLGSGMNRTVTHLATIDDGTGPALFAAGSFSTAAGAPALRIAKWDGNSWRGLSSGADGAVTDLVEFDFGSGPRLVACGAFSAVGGVVASGLAVWDGAEWTALERPDPAIPVESLLRLDVPGRPPRLFSSGCLTAFPESRCFLSEWTGSGWSRIAPDPPGAVVTNLAAFDDGFGTSLYASVGLDAFGTGAPGGFARLSSGDVAPRAGTVNAGRGAIADVLLVDGAPGDAACRRVVLDADAPHRIDVLRPPAGGGGDFALWIYEGTPDPRRPVRARIPGPGGTLVDLGLSPRALPFENLVTPGAVRCPLTFPSGIASRRPATAALARALCLRAGGARPGPAPVAIPFRFPRGTFTIAGVVADPGSANARRLSLTNSIVVDSR